MQSNSCEKGKRRPFRVLWRGYGTSVVNLAVVLESVSGGSLALGVPVALAVAL